MGKRFLAIAAVLASLAFAFFGAGTATSTSDETTRVIVQLRTDFAPEGGMSPQARGRQRAAIAKQQGEVRKQLRGHKHRELHNFETVPLMSLELSQDAIDAIRGSDTVASIQPDAKRYPSLAQSSPLIEADDLWTDGATGAGTTVAILDTGVDKTHPFLGGRVVEEACYSGGGFGLVGGSVCPGGVSSSTASGSGAPCSINGCDHGTHVAGIAAGAGATQSGVAKGANIMSVQVFSRDGTDISAYRSDIIKGLERVYAVRATRSIASVNMSLGGGRFTSQCNGEAEKTAIDNLLSAGIPTAIATGNDGWSDAVSSPACITSSVAVASTTKNDGISNFSNNHPTLTDVLAPGTSINSSVPGGGFASFSGTSMATPHVAGAFALMREASPDASVASLLNALQSTGLLVQDPIGNPPFNRPRVRLAQAAVSLDGGGGGGGGGAETFTVAFSVAGAGRGRIIGPGIECSNRSRWGTDCAEEYDEGTLVEYVARPIGNSRFVRWTGDFSPCGVSKGCYIPTIGSDFVATARFKKD